MKSAPDTKIPGNLHFRGYFAVRKMGLEPTRCDHHKILSLARLPIPTLPRTNEIIAKMYGEVNTKFIKYVSKYVSGKEAVKKACEESR